MSGPVRVRDAVLADVDVIVDANVAMAMESEGKVLDRATVDRGVERLLRDPTRGRYLVAVVVDGCGRETIVGQLMLTLEWSDWRDGWWWWIQSVYVAPSFRRRGVYRALHDHVVAAVEADPGVCGVRLYVEPENETARATYRALGMVETYRVMELPRRG
jgi:ribosomal protein S18 acetylase RimI-like enzyme